jgi:drug/metabolite transporter (DMT)-like permease
VNSSAAIRFAPLLFVILWSTGFIGAKYGLPHAEPLSFLLVRYLFVVSLMTLLALAMRAPWPARRTPVVPHRGFRPAGACDLPRWRVRLDFQGPAGRSRQPGGRHPAPADRGRRRLAAERGRAGPAVAGLVLGFVGVAMVVSGKIGSGFGLDALWPALAALAGITAGTLYQKRFCPSFDWRTGAIAQFLPTAVATAIVVGVSDNFRVEWVPDFIFALAWLVLVLSLGAVSLLNMLIRRGTAVNLASLFYLVPPCTALIAWLLFDERLAGMALVGMALAVWGVYLARK